MLQIFVLAVAIYVYLKTPLTPALLYQFFIFAVAMVYASYQ